MAGIDDFFKFKFDPLMPCSSEIPDYIKKKEDIIIPIRMNKIFIGIIYSFDVYCIFSITEKIVQFDIAIYDL